MDPLTIIAALSASLTLAKELIPQLGDMLSKGEITKEQQEKLLAEYNSLKERAEGQFSGPEWEKSGRGGSR